MYEIINCIRLTFILLLTEQLRDHGYRLVVYSKEKKKGGIYPTGAYRGDMLFVLKEESRGEAFISIINITRGTIEVRLSDGNSLMWNLRVSIDPRNPPPVPHKQSRLNGRRIL
jgi:hypothetical protein